MSSLSTSSGLIAGVLATFCTALPNAAVEATPRAVVAADRNEDRGVVECFLQTAPRHSKPGPGEDAYHQTTGTVERVRGGQIVLREYDGSTLLLLSEPDTRVFAPSGASLPLSHLREGTDVRASYLRLDGQDRAVKLEVLGPKKPTGQSGVKTTVPESDGGAIQPVEQKSNNEAAR